MLTDTALRNLKPKSKAYKAFDRDGMYVTVSPSGIYRRSVMLASRHYAMLDDGMGFSLVPGSR